MFRAACRACWIATGATPGSGRPSLVGEERDVADDEHVRVPGDRQIAPDRHAPRAVERARRDTRASGVARTPAAQSTVARRDALLRRPAPHPRVDRGHERAGAHLDAERPRASAPRARGELGREGRQDARPGLDEHDARVAGIDAAEVARAGVAARSRAIAPASSTPVGPPPTITKVSSARRASGVAARARRASNASRMRRRISSASSMRLEPGRDRAPLVVAEVGVPRARREHEVVVGERDRPSG